MRTPSDRRVLDEATGARAMTGVMAVMLFLTVLAAAAGLATLAARGLLARQLAGRVTVLVIDADAGARAAAAGRVAAALRAAPQVARVAPVSAGEVERLLGPWLGSDAADPELPRPAMIDVDLAGDGDADLAAVERLVHAAAPAAEVDRHAAWMSPVTGLMTTMVWLAAALVLLMAAATAAVVVLAARAGLETHRATIEVMHMLGATDRQVARLFQRRIALDAALGGVGGALAAALVLLIVGRQLAALGSELLAGLSLTALDWLLLAALPLGFVLLATLAARGAITLALRHRL